MQIQCYNNLTPTHDVVICFKFSNFAYANTVLKVLMLICSMLLFALNLVTLLMQIQCPFESSFQQWVVICFKFSNFAYANTVLKVLMLICSMLLFALNLVTLLMQIQCPFESSFQQWVVICFKFSNFAYANTVRQW